MGWRKGKRSAWFVAYLALELGGCQSAGPVPQTDSAASPTFSWLNTHVFQPRCLECHSGPKREGTAELSTYEGITSRRILTPGQPEDSELYLAVSSGKMPRHGNKLTQDELRALHAWIKAGAPR